MGELVEIMPVAILGKTHQHPEPGGVQAADHNVADGKGKEGAEVSHGSGKLGALNSKDFIFMNASRRTDKKCMFRL